MVHKRKHIGIIYHPDNNWIAGAYYVQNIISSLSTLQPNKRPVVHIICNNKKVFNSFVQQTEYFHIRYNPDHFNKINLKLRAIARKITKIPFNNQRKLDVGLSKVSFIYPITDINTTSVLKDINKALAWIPDFQEKYYPDFFSKEEIEARQKIHQYYIDNKIPIVFSSQNSYEDFIKFYKVGENHKCYVLPFSVKHPNFSHIDINLIKQKFHINKKYLFCANQFWVHKNHLFLFKAFLEAKRKGLDLQLVCSGKMHDYRDKTYNEQINRFISDNKLHEDILLLGFISREEQLCLMNNSYAVVQPSLFEGWSTVVEDAKKINKFIFLSDLKVHREQSPINACFFDPYDISSLANKLLKTNPTSIPYNYNESVNKCAESFYNIINDF